MVQTQVIPSLKSVGRLHSTRPPYPTSSRDLGNLKGPGLESQDNLFFVRIKFLHSQIVMEHLLWARPSAGSP